MWGSETLRCQWKILEKNFLLWRFKINSNSHLYYSVSSNNIGPEGAKSMSKILWIFYKRSKNTHTKNI
jgi:hypothetical protein